MCLSLMSMHIGMCVGGIMASFAVVVHQHSITASVTETRGSRNISIEFNEVQLRQLVQVRMLLEMQCQFGGIAGYERGTAVAVVVDP